MSAPCSGRVAAIAVNFALAACAPPDPAATTVAADAPGTTRLEAVLGGPSEGFERADRVRPLRFPEDHGPHPGFRHEWWYVTGNLDAEDGGRYGFELTFFRFALRPPAGDAAPLDDAVDRSRWRTSQVYLAHFAVTDVPARRFIFSERYARGGAIGLAGAQPDPFRVWLDDWEIAADPGDSTTWRLRADGEGYALDLRLAPETPPVAQGEQGLSRKSTVADAASYYYSWPRLRAAGRLVHDGRTRAVRGLAWLDREWGSGALDPQQVGWDWFALQLDDGRSLMLYALRRRDGSTDPASAGSVIAADGTSQPLLASDFAIEVLDRWASPRGGLYPARWRLRVPSAGLDLEVVPVMADQELDTTPRYWEGAVDVRDQTAGGRAAGRGFVELVGYATGDRGATLPR
jgi:predicted secreted hydrolase